MFLAKTPALFRFLLPACIWRVHTREKILYLTFDDGPIPELTPWVLETLAAFNAKATFFCVGENILKHPEIFDTLLTAGHAVGNHTFNHLNGLKTGTEKYLQNVAEGRAVYDTKLFRPPYGMLRPGQYRNLKKQYKIVMWDVLSWDFRPEVSVESCLENVLQHAREGSIVVLHDNIKATANLQYALPRILSHFTALGYRFEALKSAEL